MIAVTGKLSITLNLIVNVLIAKGQKHKCDCFSISASLLFLLKHSILLMLSILFY